MKPCDQVHAYYQGIAAEYDRSRFENGYGAFVHAQEAAFVQKWLPLGHGKQVLNLGCGTGRFMEHATVGLDFSENMLDLARQKFPQHAFLLSDARELPLPNQSMDAVLCLHVLMHQDQQAASGSWPNAQGASSRAACCWLISPVCAAASY